MAYTSTPSFSNIFGAQLDGWNLVGNPLLSAYDLYNWNPGQDIVPQLSIRTPNGYETYSFSEANEPLRYLAPGQAFWLRKSSSGGAQTLDFLVDRRLITAQQNAQNKTQSQALKFRIQVLKNNEAVEQTRLYFRSEATDAYEEKFDADKLPHEPALYTLVQGKPLAVNSLSELVLDKIIPLNFEAEQSGAYQLSLDQSENSTSHEVWLHDKLLNKNHLLSSSDYSFQHQTTNDKYRFELTFKADQIGVQNESLEESKAWIYQQHLFIKTNYSACLEVKFINMQGQVLEVLHINKKSQSTESYPIPKLPKGIYSIQITTERELLNFKSLFHF